MNQMYYYCKYNLIHNQIEQQFISLQKSSKIFKSLQKSSKQYNKLLYHKIKVSLYGIPRAVETTRSISRQFEDTKPVSGRSISEVPEYTKPLLAKQKFGNIVATDLPKYQNIMLERFRTRLSQRGGKGIIGIERQFKVFDLDGSGYLEKPEFMQAVLDYKLEIDERDLENLFKIFDKNKDGRISYMEFMDTIIGRMSEFRESLTIKAFESLDEDEDGFIDLQEVSQHYNAKLHPEVKAGRKTEEEEVSEFLSSFEMHHRLCSPESEDTQISREEFLQYYNKISATIERDTYSSTILI